MSEYKLQPCCVCGKTDNKMAYIADLGYLGDGGEFADLPPVLGYQSYCLEHNPEYHLVYSVKGNLIGKLDTYHHIKEMVFL